MEEDSKISTKVSGYLEKKGKMKMMSSYKKYWFVLEGRLLLYYRSKDEYEAISPCKGSINLGPPCHVKPCSSTHGVFQIETRTNTITLRAESQEDQIRWMQGIMSALNQTKNPQKLGHFRYSLGELPQEQIKKYSLQRHSSIENNFPSTKDNQSPPPADPSQNQMGIIQRLQKIGAQSYYGGSIGAINQMPFGKKSERSNSEESLQSPTDKANFRSSMLVENDQYNENDFSKTVELRGGNKCFENIYERISRDSTESTNNDENINYHASKRKTDERHKFPKATYICNYNLPTSTPQDPETPNRPSTFLLDNEVYSMSKAITAHQNRNIRGKKNSFSEAESPRPTSFLLENETYATSKARTQKNKDHPCREREDSFSQTGPERPTTFLMENETYATCQSIATQKDHRRASGVSSENCHYHLVDKNRITPNNYLENVYANPKCQKLIDHNENNLILNNSQRVGNVEENAYSVIKLYDSDKNIRTNIAAEYEDLDVVEYTEVKDAENDTTSNDPGRNKSKTKKIKKKNKNSTDGDGKEIKLKKSSSFIRRVWKKKSKHKETDDNDENLYETVPAGVVQKVGMTDNTAIQMLSELHNILENKKPILSDRLSGESHTSNQKRDKREAPIGNNTAHGNDETAVQMLTELQNILESKKNILTARISIDKDEKKTGAVNSEKRCSQNETHRRNSNDIQASSTSSGSEKGRPLIPLKQQKPNVDSPYHDIPKNNQLLKLLPPKMKRNLEHVKSLDEILDDLENHEDISKNKVKKLIKQFSDSDFNDDDVVLRNNSRPHYIKEDVDSNELSRLLDELAKVTCAPILTPGVTTSLINTNLTDEELLNLIPKRRRRYSEPDYDIPRPHKSLTNLPKREIPSDNAIGSTRFFGPILKPSDITIKSNNIKDSSEDIPSMTPDSLEVEPHALCPQQYLSEDEKNVSYTSHNYDKNKMPNSCGKRNKEDYVKHKNLSQNIDNSLKRFDDIIIATDIYAEPKFLRDMSATKHRRSNNDVLNSSYKDNRLLEMKFEEEKAQEDYVDSLETS